MLRKRGFSLLELTVTLVIAGLVASVVLRNEQSQQNSGTDCIAATRTQLATIQGAITRFARSNDRLPLPARRFVGTDSPNYGREATIDQLTQTADGSVTSGALPWQALGIPSSYAGDCWGNKFSYMVTTNLTTKQTPAYGGHDGVILRKNAANLTIDDKIAYAVISHGADALGAVKTSYDDTNAATPDRKWCSGTTIAHTNCLGNVAIVTDAPFNDGATAGANYFDDIIVASGRPQILFANCSLPWGGTLAHGASVTAYSNFAACTSETRTCTDGILSGSASLRHCSSNGCLVPASFSYAGCTASSGTLGGTTIAVGGGIPWVDSVAPTITAFVPMAQFRCVAANSPSYSGTCLRPCPATPATNWIIGGRTCSASRPATSPPSPAGPTSMNVAITDSTAPNTGTANTVCNFLSGAWSVPAGISCNP